MQSSLEQSQSTSKEGESDKGLSGHAVDQISLGATQNLWLEKNQAGLDGGAMHIEAITNSGNLNNVTMIGNQASSFGGAINLATTLIYMENSLTANNVADLYGGGLFAFFAGLIISNSNITGNS